MHHRRPAHAPTTHATQVRHDASATRLVVALGACALVFVGALVVGPLSDMRILDSAADAGISHGVASACVAGQR